jgi:hypothetical protein
VREVNTDHRIQLQHLVQAALAPGTYQRLSQFCEEDFDETNSRKNQQMAKKKRSVVSMASGMFSTVAIRGLALRRVVDWFMGEAV